MATADEVLITVRTTGVKAAGTDIDRTRKKLEGLGRAARGVGKDVRRTTRDLERLTTAASDLSVADALGVKSGGGRRTGSGGIENARASLARMRSDVGKTNVLLRQMDLRAPKGSPFAVSEIAGSARQLQGFNRAAQRTVGAMRSVRVAASGPGRGSGFGSGGGVGARRLDRVTEQPGPVGTPGRPGSRGQRRGGRAEGRTLRPADTGRPHPRLDERKDAGRPHPRLDEWKGPGPRKTPREARDELRQAIVAPVAEPAGKIKDRLNKEREAKLDPAMTRLYEDAKTAVEQRDPIGGIKSAGGNILNVGKSLTDMSLGGLAGAGAASFATWATNKAKDTAKKRAMDEAKKRVIKPLATRFAQTTAGSAAETGVLKGMYAMDKAKSLLPSRASALRAAGSVGAGLATVKAADKVTEKVTGTGFLERLHQGMTGRIRGVLGMPGTRFGPSGGGSSNTITPQQAVTLSPAQQAAASFLGGGSARPITGYRPSPPAAASTSRPHASATPYSKPMPQATPIATPAAGAQRRAAQPAAQRSASARRSSTRWSPPAIPSYGGMKVFGRATGGTVRPGELTLVGEQGPEIARFPSGTEITSNRATRSQAAGAASGTRGRARDRVVRETPLNLALDGQVFYRAVSRQTELVELRG